MNFRYRCTLAAEITVKPLYVVAKQAARHTGAGSGPAAKERTGVDAATERCSRGLAVDDLPAKVNTVLDGFFLGIEEIGGASLLYYVQAGDVFEVTDIAGDNSEAELQRGGGDQQILEGDGHAVRGLVALDVPGEPGGFDGDGVHG